MSVPDSVITERGCLSENGDRALNALTIWCWLFFGAVLMAQGFYCFKRPTTGPDTLIYYSLLQHSTQADVAEAARECPSQDPGPHNGCIPTTADFVSELMSYTPQEFATFLRFYTVKPFYTGSARVLQHAFHLQPFIALRLLSSLSYVTIGAVLALWLNEHLSVYGACLSALLIVALPPVVTIGKFLLPDAFSAALILPVIFLILYKVRRLSFQLVLLALLPLARPDNLLFGALWASLLVYRATPNVRQRALRLVAVFAGCAVLNLALQRATHALPFTVLFHHSFIATVPPSDYARVHVSLREYARTTMGYGTKTIVLHFPLPALFAFLTLASNNTWRPLRDLVAISMFAAFLRLALFPAQEERYYTWFLLIAAAGATATIGELSRGGNSWFRSPVKFVSPAV